MTIIMPGSASVRRPGFALLVASLLSLVGYFAHAQPVRPAVIADYEARGYVLLDALSAKAMENYLFARAVVGHEYASPVVQPRE